MEISTLRGTVSVRSQRGGWFSWSRTSVARNLSLGVHARRVERPPSLFQKGRFARCGNILIQSCRSEGTTDEMAVSTRFAGLDSLRCHHHSQRFDAYQGLSTGLHIGNKFRFARSPVSWRGTVSAPCQSFCTGAFRFHTASVREGRYISINDGGRESEEGQSLGSSECTHEVSDTVDDIHNELAPGVASSFNADVESDEDVVDSSVEHWIVNFYHFVSIDDPHLEVARHAEFLKDHDVRGRIYISEQGINAQLSSRGKAAVDYAEWVRTDPRFSDLLVQTSPSSEGHAFPRLRLRYKPSLVQVEGGTQHLPVTDPTARAVPLSPAEWTKKLVEAKVVRRTKNVVWQEDSNVGHEDSVEENLSSSSTRPVVLLDVRNGYEWDVGHFKGAQRPNVDCFKSTAVGLAQDEDLSDDPLADVDKEKVDVMMYCTGGIRCDVYSTMLRAKGFKNLYSLKGGVSNYLKEEGAKVWAGNLFVFDSRLAVPPEVYHSKSSQEGGTSEATLFTKAVDSSAKEAFARCRLCGDPLVNPRHRNCANLDCNQLYLSCDECLPQYQGCCCHECSSAPKLRPLISKQQYERWHKYRATELAPPKPADYVSRRAMKRRRRKERRKQLMMGGAS